VEANRSAACRTCASTEAAAWSRTADHRDPLAISSRGDDVGRAENLFRNRARSRNDEYSRTPFLNVPADRDKATEVFQQVIAREPAFAPAQAELANAYALMSAPTSSRLPLRIIGRETNLGIS
jgi:hypothetical protein